MQLKTPPGVLWKNRKKGTVRGHSKNKNGFSRGGVVSTDNFEGVKMSVTVDTSTIHDKTQKYKSSKKYEKKASKKGENRPIFKNF